MTNQDSDEQLTLSKRITLGALVVALFHVVFPKVAVDAVTLTLLGVALVPWLGPIFKSLEFPGGAKIEYQELRKAAQDQVSTALHQTVATVITWISAEEVRQSRKVLFDLDDQRMICRVPPDQWDSLWKDAADRTSQAFNSAGIIAKQDPRLQDIWIRPTRRAILKSWHIAYPRIQERRKQQADLWQDFEWLAQKARDVSTPAEQAAWTTHAA